MGYLKYTPYLYLAVAIFCFYDGFTRMNEPDSNYMLSFLIAAAAVAMFAFRLSFAKRMEKRNRDRKNGQ